MRRVACNIKREKHSEAVHNAHFIKLKKIKFKRKHSAGDARTEARFCSGAVPHSKRRGPVSTLTPTELKVAFGRKRDYFCPLPAAF